MQSGQVEFDPGESILQLLAQMGKLGWNLTFVVKVL